MQAYLHRDNGPREICNRPRQICRCNVLVDSRGTSSSPRCDSYPPAEGIFDEQVALSIPAGSAIWEKNRVATALCRNPNVLEFRVSEKTG